MLVKDKKIKIVLDNDISKPYNVLNKQKGGEKMDDHQRFFGILSIIALIMAIMNKFQLW